MAKSALTKSLLSNLSRGISTTRILDCPANGEVTLSGLDFSSGGVIYSIEDSFQFDWGAPTINPIRVDQGKQVIAIDTDEADITFAANYPVVAEAALAEFFKMGSTSNTVTAATGVKYAGKSIFIKPQTTEVSLCIEDSNEEYALVLARVALTARIAYDADNEMWYIALEGQVLSNLKEDEGDVLFAPASA